MFLSYQFGTAIFQRRVLKFMNKILTIAGGLAVAATANAVLYTYSAGAGTIPDNNPAGTSVTFNVTDRIFVKDVQVKFVGLNHTWIGDLAMTLTNSSSTTAVLFDRVGRTATTGFGQSGDFLAANAYSWSNSPGFFDPSLVMPTVIGNLASGNYQSFLNATPGSSTSNNPNGLNALVSPTQDAFGTWTLFAGDYAGGDLGGWTSVDLIINGNPVPEPATMTALALGLGALVARRRRK